MAAVAQQERETVRAQAKWVRMPARKARLVTDHIRGRSVPEARTVLAFTQRAAAREIEKVLRSAVANAEANNGLVGDDLMVVRAYVDEGPTMKRWRARARGRVARIHKRTCHITIELAEPLPPANAPRASAEVQAPKRVPRRKSATTEAAPKAEKAPRKAPKAAKTEETPPTSPEAEAEASPAKEETE